MSLWKLKFTLLLQLYFASCSPDRSEPRLHISKFVKGRSLINLVTNDNCTGAHDNITCGTVEYLGCTGSKKFYHESAIKMNWFESWEYCRSLGLHLASVDNRYEQTFIEIFLPPIDSNLESYWTSGNDLGREGQFSWMATGGSVTYTNFRPGEPNNRFGSEHCLEMVIKQGTIGFLWNDRNCLATAYTLCQQDLRYPEKFIDAESVLIP